MDAQETGRFIRRRREEAGLTQQDLADTIGVSLRALGGYERGERVPKVETLVALGDALMVDWRRLVQKSA